MNKKKINTLLTILFLCLGANFFLSIPFIKGNGSIPSEYYQQLDLNGTYEYNVTKFDDRLNWWNLDWVDQGWINCSPGGNIIVNFTGFYPKHSNDNSPFPSPTP